MKHLLASIAMLACLSAGAADEYPNRPIRLLVGFNPGSSVDVVSRIFARKLEEKLGKPVVVENRSGAGGAIAAEAVANAAPDGYTLLSANNGLAIAPALNKKLRYDPKALIAVAQMTLMPWVVLSPTNLPANTIPELIAYAKANPKLLNLGSAGSGNGDHLAGELLKSMANIEFTHVPYKGGGEVISAVISGDVHVFFSGLPGALPQLQSKKVKALGVSTARRSWALPNVPAIAETLPGYDISLWYGLMAPAGTPPDITNKISTAIRSIVASPEMAEALKKIGADGVDTSRAQFQAFYESELVRWGMVIKDAGITAE